MYLEMKICRKTPWILSLPVIVQGLKTVFLQLE